MTDFSVGNTYQLELGFVAATPAGAFYAVQSAHKDGVCQYLLFLLAQNQTPLFERKHLRYLHDNEESAMQILYRMQQLGYIQVLEQAAEADQGPLENVLPSLLAKLSGQGKALLADEQGFYLAMSGYAHESAEELSALSAGLHEVHERHKALLHNNIGVKSTAFGIVDAAGNSEIGFWPLYFSRTRFSLIIEGLPRFNSLEFTRTINYLAIRYSN